LQLNRSLEMRLFYFLVLVFGLPTISFGQLNLSVLYSSSYTQPDTHQSIIDQFNADRPGLTKQFEDIRFLNGYGLGLRYKVDRIAFNTRWENQIDRLRANGTDNNNEAFEQTLFFKLTTFSFGIESFFSEHLSIHGSFEFNNARYRTELNDSDKFDLANDWATGSTLSIGYNFIGGSLMHVSLRPFIHISWTNHDLIGLHTALNPDVPATRDFDEEFLNFGIKLIFYNGQW